MKKLMFFLTLFSSLAFANNELYNLNKLLPDGHYAGEWTMYSGIRTSTNGHIVKNFIDMNLGPMTEWCNYHGHLYVSLELNDDNQCSSSAAMLHLNEGTCKFLRDIPIEFTSCNWDGSHLKGSHKITIFPALKGSFDFILIDVDQPERKDN